MDEHASGPVPRGEYSRGVPGGSSPRGEHSRPRAVPGRNRPARAHGLGEAILAAAADGVVAVDRHGVIRFANRAAAELLGRDGADLTGTALGYRLSPGQVTEIELAAEEGAERVLDVRAAAATADGQPVTVAVLRDVTHRKLSERAMEAALERQSAALSVAAHELHSPLAAIGVLAGLLADQQAELEPRERIQVAERIADLARRLQQLMRRLLTSAQIEAGVTRAEPEQVSVLEVIIDQLAVHDTEPGAITVSCPPGLAVIADRSELAMMLANYLDNALAHGRPPVEVRAAASDGWARIQVTDRGPGVPESFVPALFERFARAPQRDAGGRPSRASTGGSAGPFPQASTGIGLGLWIVRTLAQANGGDAWYRAGEHGGACFCLRLPLAAGGR